MPSYVAIASEAGMLIPRLLATGSQGGSGVGHGHQHPVKSAASKGAGDILALFQKKFRLDLLALVVAASTIDVDIVHDPSSSALSTDAVLTLPRFLQFVSHKCVSQPQMVLLLLKRLAFDPLAHLPSSAAAASKSKNRSVTDSVIAPVIVESTCAGTRGLVVGFVLCCAWCHAVRKETTRPVLPDADDGCVVSAAARRRVHGPATFKRNNT